jgi:hypothetical protein
LQIEGPKLKLFKAFCKNFHSIESKAFSKSTNYMSNWHPISLLNTDLKIASAAIANRFKQVLGGIISDTQKGFKAIFKSVFSKLIGCQLLIYCLSLLSLGIQVITPRV